MVLILEEVVLTTLLCNPFHAEREKLLHLIIVYRLQQKAPKAGRIVCSKEVG